jgi:hypothetical protein
VRKKIITRLEFLFFFLSSSHPFFFSVRKGDAWVDLPNTAPQQLVFWER